MQSWIRPSAALCVGLVAGVSHAEPTAQAGGSTEPTERTGASGAKRGNYVDADGSLRSADRAYERVGRTREPHHLRSWAEMGVGLGVGAVIYWVGLERNAPDWDNPRLEHRFDGTAWRLDNNSLPVNFALHPLVGGAAYAFARGNHHSVATAAGYTFLTSFIWEFAFEFKEMVSVNDVLVTPVAGIPVGEFFHKLGLYLGSAERPSSATQVAQWTLGTGVQLDQALDGTSGPPPLARDSLGMTSDIWHDFESDYEFHFARGVGPNEYAMQRLGLRGRLVSIPGYLRPGSFGRFFHRADLASFELRGEASARGGGVAMAADTLLLGYHDQQLHGARLPTRGHASTVGLSVAYRFFESEANDFAGQIGTVYVLEPGVDYNVHKYNEQFSAVHLPGPALDWHVLARGVRLEVSARAHPDFAGVGALAYSDWANANPRERGKAILLKQGYFYGWGGSGELSGRLTLGPQLMQGAVFYGRYRSQEGLERQPEKLTVDVPAGADVHFCRGSLRLQPSDLPVAFGVSAAVRRWDSWVGGFRRQTRMLSRGLHASVRF